MKDFATNIEFNQPLTGRTKHLVFTVTTDLSYDQRMIRICTSLVEAGFNISLVGRKMKNAIPLIKQPFTQHRINCIFEKGKLFYAEYNIRLFFFLLSKKMDCITAIDLDSILACYGISRIKKINRVYDAHELFCEMKEIVTRPIIYRIWKKIEQFAVPKFPLGYTVSLPIAEAFKKMYGVSYGVVQNIALLRPLALIEKKEKYILYQGAVNEGRCFETLIPAMAMVDSRLIICGDGNFMQQAIDLVCKYNLQDKIIFKGRVEPAALRLVTQQAYFGLTLFDDTGLSNYFSLANRFFDYLHAGIPQLVVDYPVYHTIIKEHHVGLLVNDLSIHNLALQMNLLLQNEVLYTTLQHNCIAAREKLNWQSEAEKLIHFYTSLPYNK